MIALDDRRFRAVRRSPLARPVRAAESSSMLLDAGEPAAFPASTPTASAPATTFTTVPVVLPTPAPVRALAPAREARLLRRLRRVSRRRLRVDLAGLRDATVTDGDLDVQVTTISPRDPYLVEWTADRLVALVVLYDGCGARVIGGGGYMGRVELPSIARAGAFLAFCYDAEAGPTGRTLP